MIEVKNVKKIYGKGENLNEVLKGVSLTVDKGSSSVIIGASGSGKSTLLNVMSGLESPNEGQVLYDGCDISRFTEKELTAFRKAKVGFIFQQYYLLPNLNVDKNVKMGADLVGNKDYADIIEAVGLGDKRNKYPAALSGGEQQRVAIARALAKKPEVLCLDEPTG
ncbi:MAG: ABC transporter ATP-binding protein, partial [Clostridia bacterium]|nr:ABC transporter ATP-binding protein [Clostridia bacterium]